MGLNKKELQYIHPDHIDPVKVDCKGLILLDLQPVKEMSGLAAPAVVGRQHIRSHRFAETAGAADAQVLLQGIQHLVGIGDEPAFVHIDF